MTRYTYFERGYSTWLNMNNHNMEKFLRMILPMCFIFLNRSLQIVSNDALLNCSTRMIYKVG